MAMSQRVLVSPEDDKDCGWYARVVAAPTVGLVGENNVPFPQKWNFAPTMGVVEDISNFCGWVDKLLKTAPIDGRSWKTLSNRYGWKVKTHGFAIRGVTAEAVADSRVSSGTRTPSGTHISLERAREIVLSSSSAKRKTIEEEDSKEEEDGGSLVTRPRARRHIVSDDEAEVSPRLSVPLIEPVETQ
ncbi:uncharacterized protein LOC107822373 isoform X2 [Nicotiana tabacum]|uniref:Uncharacterized protein LOC107822373 isoform X2 n=1 Tax=Nicotiana tabacum TaxID=4097 RepID=A0AC58SX29_TOBAC